MSLGEEAQCPRKFFMSSGTNMKPDFPGDLELAKNPLGILADRYISRPE